jgi:hypothetical protein
MREFKIKIVIWFTFLLLSILLTVLEVHFDTRIEVRNGFLENMLNGALTFWIVFILLAIVFSDMIVNEFIKFKLIRYLLATLIVCINIIVFIAATFFTFSESNLRKDTIVYENSVNSHEKIICEFMTTGITGNGNWRIIKTTRKNFIIRPIQVISDTALRNELVLGEYPEQFKPKTIFNFQNKTYALERKPN